MQTKRNSLLQKIAFYTINTFTYVTFIYTICYIRATSVHYVTNKQIHVTEKFALSEEINYLCTRKKITADLETLPAWFHKARKQDGNFGLPEKINGLHV